MAYFDDIRKKRYQYQPVATDPNGVQSPTVRDSMAIYSRYKTPGTTASFTPPTPSLPSVNRFVGGMPSLSAPGIAPAPTPAPVASGIPTEDEAMNYFGGSGAPPAATAGVPRPAENSIQRWQNFGRTALDQRPVPPPDFTPGQLRRITTGRIGGPVMPSPSERMPGGATSTEDWRKIFGRNTRL